MDDLSTDDKKLLLSIARDAIAKRLGIPFDFSLPKEIPQLLLEKRGAFVTLHINGALRGCIGNFVSDEPLYRLVADMAISSAFSDPRFRPLTPGEFYLIDIEISVLSPLKPIKDVEEIEVGKHGIYIIKDYYRGVLLPQVATQYGWDRYQFLDQTCIKAGMRPGCWKDKNCHILIFSAEIFGEKELKA